ncbi:MAG: ABC transporter ATP-binding protein [Planctomycetes bacterium]|nr:ABC transporter ATP-binding protein [Planctomycetota bacterium]
MAEPLLQLTDVRVAYGAIEALKGISLEVNAGEIVMIIGANGAGKTTTLMTVSGLIPLLRGEVRLRGEPLAGRKPHEIVRLGVAQVPEGRRIFPRLTVRENLEMGAFTRSDPAGVREDLDRMFGLFPILKERLRQKGGTLSGGEQQMLAIARGLMSRPSLLLLDEPSLGLAPLFVAKVFQIIRQLHDLGVTILLVEQNARMALKLASRGYVMETGTIVAADRSENLLKDPKILKAYLGE